MSTAIPELLSPVDCLFRLRKLAARGLLAALGAVLMLNAGGCGAAPQERQPSKQENKRPRFANWHAVVDGKVIGAGAHSDVPIEFVWAGHQWRVPARAFPHPPQLDDDGLVTDMYFPMHWDGKRLLLLHEPGIEQMDVTVVAVMPAIRYEQKGSHIERWRGSYGDPIPLDEYGLQVFPKSKKPSSEGMWQAIHMRDRMGIPIEFVCHLQMKDIVSGLVFRPADIPYSSQCDGVLNVRGGFGVRYRFSVKNVSESTQLAGAVMTLVDSWIVEE